ncbi:FAD-binding oxidoreductase [Ilumatobacter sp.]|uniref:FAD-binding oxidoreductase n=1 Tax=Ilumatobacter sp. TaxID=1967498 RepID=UPI003B524DA8
MSSVAPAGTVDVEAVADLEVVAAALRARIDPAAVRSGATETRLYRRDASTMSGAAAVVVFASSTDDVRAAVEVANDLGVPFVARGSGTGLAGGAVPRAGSIVISTSKMDRILSVDPVNRQAWVEPGVLNLDLSRRIAHHGVHFAPDPSSQQTCSIGGNVANNSGGPHCLADGVTSSHVLALEVVLPDGSVTVLGGEEPEPDGLDLRGAFVGSEGMFGVATKVCVKLTQDAPDVATMLMEFDSVAEGAQLVSDIIAAGIVPAAVEMMDQLCLRAVEAWLHAGLPVDAAAALLVECVGEPGQVADEVARIEELAAAGGVARIRTAADEAERAVLWKGRKGAFGAVAQVKPNYYLHDTVVPRARLAEVIEKVYEITERAGIDVINVFHAGDGNLHPLLVYDAREEGMVDKVHAAGREIVRFSVEVGGVLSGEHGIGLEKRDMMSLMFSEVDLAAQETLRTAFDPRLLANPDKVLPNPATCGDVQAVPPGAWI